MAFIFSLKLQAQNLKGIVLDRQSLAPVPFASIGLVKANVGTSCGEDGSFSLGNKVFIDNDTLIVSCVGYQSALVPIDKNNPNYTIYLDRSAAELKEIIISDFPNKLTITSSSKKTAAVLYTMNIGSHSQAAQLFHLPVTNARLEAVRLPLKEKDRSRFRIRIYDFDSLTQQPGRDLCDATIDVTGYGETTVSLKQYHIIIPGEKFFVAVQWLFLEENIAGQTVHNNEARNFYRPGIRITGRKEKGESYRLDHNGYWSRWNGEHPFAVTVSF